MTTGGITRVTDTTRAPGRHRAPTPPRTPIRTRITTAIRTLIGRLT
jgi:hypothetical protein